MTTFMDKDFLLNTETARKLYHDYAAAMPHHRLPLPHQSARRFGRTSASRTITKVWLGGDHYKWRLMRCAGVEENYITGKDASDYEKFCQMGRGHRQEHRQSRSTTGTHLELQRFFGYEGTLSAKHGRRGMEPRATEKLQRPGYTARGLIAMSNVETICTTDDPDRHPGVAPEAGRQTIPSTTDRSARLAARQSHEPGEGGLSGIPRASFLRHRA